MPDTPPPNTPCLEWIGAKSAGGYGYVNAGGKGMLIHRMVIEAVIGPIPDGLHVDHLCRNRACYRFDHLELVTPAENTRRGDAGLHMKEMPPKTHCPNGHEFTQENTYINPYGTKICRICRQANIRRYRERKKGSRSEQRAA